MSRKITYCEAINEAIIQEMERDKNVFVYGIAVDDHKRIFGTTNNLVEKFGKDRCFDTPISEETMTGFGIGAAINGMRPIHVHMRIDFLLLAMNQLINMMSSTIYASGGRVQCPMVIRAIIGRGWGQGFQHSKSLQSLFAHIPGLKVVMPTTPSDAKGMLIASIRDNNPVIFIEHRWLYFQEGEVDIEPYETPLGFPAVLKKGNDITVVATSWMNAEALRASEILERNGVSIEIVDPRTISPLNDQIIIDSVNKTGRCVVADFDWVHCGFSAEISARIYSKCFDKLVRPIERIGMKFTPCPTARHLENEFYPNAKDIIRAVEKNLGLKKIDLSGEEFYSYEHRFKGPF